MPKPTNKTELLQASEREFEKLLKQVEDLSAEAQLAAFPDTYLNRNVRDVLAHLHHWHKLFLGWYEVGKRGEKPAMPAEGYTWKDNARLNLWIRDQYADYELSRVQALLKETHHQVMALIEAEAAETLFVKKHLPWTGSTSLGAYLISSTASHYVWAQKLIKKALKEWA
ncbi:MAG: ClbS/DfsB family four-helix bundle protein [Bacteroidota bacterium]